MRLSRCAVCDSKKLKFIKDQKAIRLLSRLEIEAALTKIPLVGSLWFNSIKQVNTSHKMNKTVTNFLLAGDKFMPEMYLRQLGLTYSACGLFTKNKEKIHTFKETGDLRYIYQNKFNKAVFQHGMAYGDFKNVTRRTASDNTLHDKAFNITMNPKYDGYQKDLASMVYNFFDEMATDGAVKNEIMQSKVLAEELHKPITGKFVKRKVYSSFLDNIWGADLADVQLLSKFNKGFRFLLCAINIYSKYIWVIPLKDKKRYYNYWCFSKNFRWI